MAHRVEVRLSKARVAVVAVVGVLGCVLLSVDIGWANGGWVVLVVGAVVVPWLIWRWNRVALIADGEEIVVRNLYRTRRFPRSRIEGFQISSRARTLRPRRSVQIVCRWDVIVEADVFFAPVVGRTRPVLDEIVRQLYEWLERP